MDLIDHRLLLEPIVSAPADPEFAGLSIRDAVADDDSVGTIIISVSI
jgi:hypothetical protein